MRFSKRGVIRVGAALAAFLFVVLVVWPLSAVGVWLDQFVPWPIPVGLGLAAAIAILIVDEVTTPEAP